VRTFHEHFAHPNGHHNGHHSPCEAGVDKLFGIKTSCEQKLDFYRVFLTDGSEDTG